MSPALTLAPLLAEAQAAIGRSEARLLLRQVLGCDEAWLIAHGEAPLSAAQAAQYRGLCARRIAGEPVAYISGSREFYGREFAVNPAVLIPRPETELLVELALALLPQGARVLDLGTGSGCIGITLAAERADLQVLLVDASTAALEVARGNAQRWAPANTTLLASHWYDAVDGARYDLIISNPPYVAEGDAHLAQGDLRFEPRSALAAGDDGLADIRYIIAGARNHLLPSGWLLFEHGYDQAEACAVLLDAAGFCERVAERDLAGIVRVSGGRCG